MTDGLQNLPRPSPTSISLEDLYAWRLVLGAKLEKGALFTNRLIDTIILFVLDYHKINDDWYDVRLVSIGRGFLSIGSIDQIEIIQDHCSIC